MSEPIFKFTENSPANPKEQKVVFQGECNVCNSVFQDLRKHVETVHKNNLCTNKDDHLEFYCQKCNIEFDIQSQFIAHNLSAHRDINSHIYEHCFKEKFQEDLESDIEIHHNTMKYLCPYCDVGFPHSNELISHMTIHIGLNAIENKVNVNKVEQQNYDTIRPPEQLNVLFNELNHILVDTIEDYVEEVANDNDQIMVLEDNNKSADISLSPLNSVIKNDATTNVEIKE